ncbi:phytanoyl-CoA dioxygenase family protein [Psychromonas arctica]|uniref:Phytanoyl-CoA dioxygenase family protein n=1 Tax=Psychromonas arctica TaxID=168275 RepID=A0ABU9H7Q2_9GAMM
MVSNLNHLKNEYDQQGYFVIQNYFTETEMSALRETVQTFHETWKADNETFFQKEAFNSSLITGTQYLQSQDRLKLFNFICSKKMTDIINAIIPNDPAFMNTQLFFNPQRPQQENFWHRDCQYDHHIEGQKKAIQETQVVHFRVPLFDEPGMELVPGSHKRWDTQEELDVRLARKRKFSSDELSTGKKIPLKAGDLLVFSADMIHRGLYGLDRLAFDTLIFDSEGDFVDYVDDDCLPDEVMLEKITNPTIFKNTLYLKSLSEC